MTSHWLLYNVMQHSKTHYEQSHGSAEVYSSLISHLNIYKDAKENPVSVFASIVNQ